jgi:hypothetical protein
MFLNPLLVPSFAPLSKAMTNAPSWKKIGTVPVQRPSNAQYSDGFSPLVIEPLPRAPAQTLVAVRQNLTPFPVPLRGKFAMRRPESWPNAPTRFPAGMACQHKGDCEACQGFMLWRSGLRCESKCWWIACVRQRRFHGMRLPSGLSCAFPRN